MSACSYIIESNKSLELFRNNPHKIGMRLNYHDSVHLFVS